MSGLLERERELTELGEMVAEARAGQGRLAVIEAPAGLGKTRLLQTARSSGEQAGMRVLAARATELERDFPFALVRQLFEPPLLGLDPPSREALFEGAAAAARGALGLNGQAPAADTFAVLHGLYWLTAALAEQQPLLLAIDDAHWADAASLDYAGFLLPRLEELPVLLVITCRPDEAGAEGSLARIATDGLARRLTPHALSRTAAATLLAAELDEEPDSAFAATCHEVSGGNPFLLHELARTVATEAISPSAEQAPRVHELAPERVARTVLVRLARLSGDAQAIVHALVVLGDDADHRLVAELAGLDAERTLAGADELRSAAILDPDASLRFVHPLVRTALHYELPAGERADAHARAADLLRARGASAQQLAAHLVATEARGDRATVETLLEAGGKALATGAPRSAITYLTRALREPAPADMRADVLHPLITACIRATDHTAFTAIQADVLAELDRDPALLLRWAVKLSTWMAITGRTEQATALLERAIAVAVEQDNIDVAFQLEAQFGKLAQLSPEAARARVARYRERIDPDSMTGRLSAALAARWALSDGTAAQGIELARHALRDDGAILMEQPELTAPGDAVMVLALADDLEHADRAARQALAYARRRSAVPELAGAWWLNAFVAMCAGDLAAAEADARQSVSVARLGGLIAAELILTPGLVLILAARGETDAAAAELARTGLAEGPIPDSPWLMTVSIARGVVRFGQGRFREAADDLVELHERKQRWGIGGSVMVQAGGFAAMALTACGERERACELAAADLAHAERWGAPRAHAFALGAMATAVGGADGVAMLERATDIVSERTAMYARSYLLTQLGMALRHTNRRSEARIPLREGLTLARRCGAGGVAKQAYDELAATGEKVRRWTPIGVESLTPSERRVAEMAASGMTNRQIAQSLFLTVKTIETHLAATYDKLGIRSRLLLPEALGERPERAHTVAPTPVQPPAAAR
ncbi:MAG TPA: AAA family ATPase [Conexibacter sp.]|nr:AAA family ATPase [Conexibacter sp.]